MTLSQDLCKVLSTLGLKQTEVHRIVDQIDNWTQSSGRKWTVNRLKDLQRLFLCRSTPSLSWNPSTWISLKQDGTPKGPFGALSRHPLRVQLAACRVYTLFADKKALREDILAFKKGIELGTKNYDLYNRHTNVLVSKLRHQGVSWLVPKFHLRDYSSLFSSVPLDRPDQKVWCVSNDGLTGYPSGFRVKPPSKLFSEIRYPPRLCGGVGSGRQDQVDQWIRSGLENAGVRSKVRDFRALSEPLGLYPIFMDYQIPITVGVTPHVGSFGFITEPGLKLRAVAMPHTALQLMLEPLKDTLFNILRTLPADCTFDQDKGVKALVDFQNQTKYFRHQCEWSNPDPNGLSLDNYFGPIGSEHSTAVAYCFDLSKATDSFPWSQTLYDLWHILDNQDPVTAQSLLLMHRCSTDSWSANRRPDCDQFWKWEVGQPLGLGPSFPAFALSHHMLMWRLGRMLDMSPDHTQRFYRLLGDDIVITHSGLAQLYHETMERVFDVRINLGKSMVSSKTAEFAGRIIHQGQIISLGKYRQISDRSFMDIARQLGPRSMPLFMPRQRRMLKLISDIPEIFGGLGWNPKGIPFEERAQKAVDLGLLDKSTVIGHYDPLTQHRRTVNKLWYGEGIEFTSWRTPDPVPTGTVMDAVNQQTRVTQSSSEAGVSDWPRASEPTGDPRGNSTLSNLENKVKRSHRKPKGLSF